MIFSHVKNVEYIDNDKQKGIKINWKEVFKDMQSLNIIPHDRFDFRKGYNFNDTKWNLIMSERSGGKTTTVLLYAILLYLKYGIVTHYIREDEDMIMPKSLKDLFRTILDNDYIRLMTDGQWNSVLYNVRRWYFCNRDSDGKVVEQSENHFMFCMSLDRSVTYKSSYTCPFGDWIIFDEFISNRYMRNDFIDLCDIISTVKRDRLSTVIIMLSNNIDMQSEYFDELEIRETVENIEANERIVCTSGMGTNVSLEYYCRPTTAEKERGNKEYFGFANDKLNAITGLGWSFNNYPHINFKDKVTLCNNVYVQCKSHVLRLEICKTNLGTVALCYKCKYPDIRYSDAIIYTNDAITDIRHRYRFGTGSKFDRFVWNLYHNNKVFYATNICGSALDNYVKVSNRL